MFHSLFGDEASMMDHQSNDVHTIGWAKFKEVNPDEFRTPIEDMQQHYPQRPDAPREPFRRGQVGPGAPWRDPNERGRPRIDPRQIRGMAPINNFGGPNRLNYSGGRFPTPFEGFGGPHKQQQLPPRDQQHPNAMTDGISHYFDRLSSTDPDVVLNQVIPVIIRQAQENLASGRLDPNQFSNLMRQVMQLKEQAMMLQADKLHQVLPGKSLNNAPWTPMNKSFNKPGDIMPQKMAVMPPPPVPIFAGGKPEVPLPHQQPPPTVNRDLPFATKEELDQISADPVSTIDIDMQPRDIRYFGEMATIVMAPGDVRELSFTLTGFEDMTRRIIIDDKLTLKLPVNMPNYMPFVLNGVEHRIKLGAPTRELWIDGQWYQCYFNESIRVQLGPIFHRVFLEGPPPIVTIGKLPLKHICLGTVQLIIDGDINYPTTIYLDSKPQLVDIAGKPHVFRFVEGIKTLLINGHPFMTQFGGTPMVVYVNQERHYLRLTSLPEGVKADRVKFQNLDGSKGSNSPSHLGQDFGPPSPPMASNENSMDGTESGSFENKAFDRLLSMLPSPSAPRPNNKESRRLTSQYSSSLNADGVLTESKPKSQTTETKSTEKVSVVPPTPEPQTVDIHNLWSQLLGAGLIAGNSAAIPGLEVSTPAKTETKQPKKEEPGKEEKEEVKKTPKPAVKPSEPVQVVKPVVLKSHDKSLKE